MNQYPNGPQQPYPNQPGYTQYPPQQPPNGYPQGPMTPPPGYPQQPMQPPVQRQPVKKKPGIFKIGCGVLAAVIVLIVVIAVANSGKSNTGTAVTTSTTNSTNSQPTQHFKVGDTVKVGTTWQAVVNSAKTDTGGQFSALKSGDVYLVVDVSLTNESNSEQAVSSIIDFTLQDSTGQKYDETVDPNAGATLDGKVEAGQPLRGILAFEVPSSIHSFTFNFAPDIVGTGQTTWDLSV